MCFGEQQFSFLSKNFYRTFFVNFCAVCEPQTWKVRCHQYDPIAGPLSGLPAVNVVTISLLPNGLSVAMIGTSIMFGVVGNAIAALRPSSTPRQRAILFSYPRAIVLAEKAFQSRRPLRVPNSKIETKKDRRLGFVMRVCGRESGRSVWLGSGVW